MHLTHIQTIGFGCLQQNELVFDRQKTNLILAPNEAGKSTLLAAIEIALYGLPSARTNEGRQMRAQHRPWAGGPSRIVLDLADDAHKYRIEY